MRVTDDVNGSSFNGLVEPRAEECSELEGKSGVAVKTRRTVVEAEKGRVEGRCFFSLDG